MEHFVWTPITRKRVRVGLAAVMPDGSPATLDEVEVAMLPLRAEPTGTTVWTTLSILDQSVLPVVAGYAAENRSNALLVSAAGSDLWALTRDGDEVDPVLIARFET